jgi:hypothetical protein
MFLFFRSKEIMRNETPTHEAVRNAEHQRQDQAVKAILRIVEASISRLGSAKEGSLFACLKVAV